MTRRFLPRFSVGLVIAALWLGTVAAPVAAAGTVRWVDDNAGADGGPAACATAGYTSIQAAIDASHSWDTVYVCPGTYVEQLDVNVKGLLVKSRPRHGAHIVAPATMDDVYGEVALVTLEAWGARLVGFDIKIAAGDLPPVTGASPSMAPTDGTCTHVDAAVLALGGRNRVNRNIIRPIGPYTLSGECGYDYGIVFGMSAPGAAATSGTTLTGTEVSRAAHNKITDFRYGGILVEGPGTKVHVDHNKIVFLHVSDPNCSVPPLGAIDSSPQQCLDAATARTLKQHLAQPGQLRDTLFGPSQLNTAFVLTFGVGVEDGAAGDVDLNSIHSGLNLFGGTASILGGGVMMIYADSSSRVRSNEISNALVGVTTGELLMTTSASPAVVVGGVQVYGNKTLNNVVGILIEDDANDVSKNAAYSNLVGIEVDGVANLIHGNNFAYNYEVDCIDTTSTDDTIATISNSWTNNLGIYSDPAGLCTPPVPF
jgi:hypothetical protein